jgi:hypothetical protein
MATTNTKQPGYMLTPKLIAMFNSLANPDGGAMVDPRESNYNGISGFELFAAWKRGDFTTGSENDALKYILSTPVTKPELSSPAAAAFTGVTKGSPIDYVDNPTTAKGAMMFLPAKEPAAPAPINLLATDTQQPSEPTPLDSALSVSNETGVTYDSPLLTYSDRAKLFKQRMTYG